MIDFERCYETKNPKNVTQFCNFLMFNKESFNFNNKKLILLLKEYKNKQTEKNYKQIRNLIEFSKN